MESQTPEEEDFRFSDDEDEEYQYSDEELEYEREYAQAMGRLSGAPSPNIGVPAPTPVPTSNSLIVEQFGPGTKGKKSKPMAIYYAGVISLEYVGEGRFGKIILTDSTGALDPYFDYIKNVKGKQIAPRKWEFTLGQDTTIKNLLNRIVTGQLLPPSMQTRAQVPQSNVNVGMAPVPFEESPSVGSAKLLSEATNLPPPEAPKTKTRPPVAPPPQQGVSTSALNLIQSQMRIDQTQTGPVAVFEKLPVYNPTAQEPGESEERYRIRIQNYNKLLQYGIQTADLLSRVRNNVDFEGVEYSATMMQYINAYLPKQ